MHFKSNPLLNQTTLNVDRENGVIRNISIVQEGPNKNGTYFSKKYLDDLANGANEIKSGVKSRFGHPTMCSTSLGSYIGRYKNFEFDGKKVTADLHLDPITKKTQVEGKGISMFEYLTDMAESNPDMFGNSIHIPRPKYEKERVKIEETEFNSHVFNGIVASDIVDDPAATSGLFDTTDLGVVMTQFLDENPQIFDVVQKDPSIIEEFFERYSQYSKNFKSNINMSFLDKLKKKFNTEENETFDVEETLADGTIVTVKTENETPQAGDAVVDEDGKPLEDGEKTVKDGKIWVIADGKISEIKDAEDDGEGDEEPTPAEMMSAINGLTQSFNAFKTQYKKDLKESQDGIELVATTFEAQLKEVKKNIKSKAPDYKSEQKKKENEFSASGYDPDKVREAREAQKKQK